MRPVAKAHGPQVRLCGSCQLLQRGEGMKRPLKQLSCSSISFGPSFCSSSRRWALPDLGICIWPVKMLMMPADVPRGHELDPQTCVMPGAAGPKAGQCSLPAETSAGLLNEGEHMVQALLQGTT